MSVHDALLEEEKKVYLLGNEAIARGLMEGGLNIAAAYPGTPSSEIMGTLMAGSKKFGFYAEWSANEKVASEVAIAASLSGLRSMVSMKGVGVNVASEPFQAFTYMGAKGGLMLVDCDDVNMYSSHTEQDNRLFAREAFMPVFEPSNPQEAKDMAKAFLELSERWRQPVILRSTTMLSHAGGGVQLSKIPVSARRGEFEREPKRWVNLPENARRMKLELLERMRNIEKEANTLEFNRFEFFSDGAFEDDARGGSDFGIISYGTPYNIVKDALVILSPDFSVDLLKLGLTYPLPSNLIEDFLVEHKNVLVVEELGPLIETEVAALANRAGVRSMLFGKDLLPQAGELGIAHLLKAESTFLEIPYIDSDFRNADALRQESSKLMVPRPPVLCAGCGHRNVFFAINIVERKAKRKFIKPSDIGCYTLGYYAPLNAVDTHFCMGASIGISCGFSKSTDEVIVSTIGDSTFFHAGIPSLISGVFNKAGFVLVILDNGTTAMTGHQVHPGVGKLSDGSETKKVMPEDVVKACGVDFVRVVDVRDLKALIKTLTDAVKAADEGKSPAVVIARGLCALLETRNGEISNAVCIDRDECTACMNCLDKFGCPAMYVENDIVNINEDLCTGCEVCMDTSICPKGSIKRRAK